MNRNVIIFIVLALSFLTSCTSELLPGGTGYLHVNVDRNDEVMLKSLSDGDEVIALDIYRKGASEPLCSFADWTEMGTKQFDTGIYRAVAHTGTNSAAAFDAPFYVGEKEFVVARDEVTNIDIECTLANVKVTAEFADEIVENFKVYRLTVSNGEGELVYSNVPESEDSEIVTLDKDGYFSVTGSLTWKLYLENNLGEVFETLEGRYEDVRARQHYNLKFSLDAAEGNKDEGAGEFIIVVDDGVNLREIDLVLDFTQVDRPRFKNEVSFRESLDFYAGDREISRSLGLKSPKEMTSLRINHESDVLAAGGMPKEVELVGASEELVSALNAVGFNVTAVTPEISETDLDFSGFFASLPAGEYSFSVYVENITGANLKREFDMVVRSRIETDTFVNAWARFANVSGRWQTDEKPEGLTFRYKAAGASEWITISAESVIIDEASRTFTAEIRGLAAGTSYTVSASCGLQPLTNEVSFTTEMAEQLHNMSFDKWYMAGKAPMPNESAEYKIWDSANPGSADVMGFSYIPTTEEKSILAVPGEGKSAAKLETLSVSVVGLAAGNIYTGSFIGTVGGFIPSGAALDWGVKFGSRPLALKGYVNYTPAPVSVGDIITGDDIGHIQVMLTTWDKPFRINTSEGTFVDINSDNIIAFGEKNLGKTDGYEDFIIELDWRDTTKKPTYIVIVAAASKYGDKFCGGVGSVLYVDEFELVYDPAELEK